MTQTGKPALPQGHNIGFVSTRFAGTDGVSLEANKWASVLQDSGHSNFWLAGRLDRNPEQSMLVPHAFFQHQEIQYINRRIYGVTSRASMTTDMIFSISGYLRGYLYQFVEKFNIDILCVQNALCIPMNVPLGLALTNFIAETGIPTIAHHHDFYWERDRFAVNAIGDFLGTAFPPTLPSIQHVTINSFAQQDLCHRRGVPSDLVPNVLDFDNPPPEADDYVKSFRKDCGLEEDDIIFLQPTRIVPRKGIEHSISLLAEINNPKCKLVISHESGDEGEDYSTALQEMAKQRGVDMRIVSDQIDEVRGKNEQGEKLYTLGDAYSQADFITYPSLYEGFGNALIEAFYFKKPVLVNRYSIYVTDIEPKGFRCITMNGYLTAEVVNQVKQVIEDEAFRKEMVEENYALGNKFFSYSVLRRKLRALVNNVTGTESG
jgi:glycosyltransferase involved in cell wall biosynthesis